MRASRRFRMRDGHPYFECPFTSNWTDYFEGGVAGTAGVAGVAGVAGTAGVVAVAGVAGIAGVAGFAGVAGVAPPAKATLTDVKTTTPSMTSVAITFIGDLLLRYRVSFLQLSGSVWAARSETMKEQAGCQDTDLGEEHKAGVDLGDWSPIRMPIDRVGNERVYEIAVYFSITQLESPPAAVARVRRLCRVDAVTILEAVETHLRHDPERVSWTRVQPGSIR